MMTSLDTKVQAAQYVYDSWMKSVREAKGFGLCAVKVSIMKAPSYSLFSYADTDTAPHTRFFSLLASSLRDFKHFRRSLFSMLRLEGYTVTPEQGVLNELTISWEPGAVTDAQLRPD